jgi:hypothetical protein
LVEDGPEVVDGIKQNAGQVVWQPPSEPDLVQFMGSIGIVFDEIGPWLFVGERRDLAFQVKDMMLCTQDGTFGTFEEIDHGDKDPDEVGFRARC